MATGLALICSALFVGSDFGHYWKDQISYNYLSVACFVGGFCWILIAFRVLVFLDSDDYERWYSRFSTTNNPQGDDVVDVEANINNDDAILEVVAGNARLEAVESWGNENSMFDDEEEQLIADIWRFMELDANDSNEEVLEEIWCSYIITNEEADEGGRNLGNDIDNESNNDNDSDIDDDADVLEAGRNAMGRIWREVGLDIDDIDSGILEAGMNAIYGIRRNVGLEVTCHRK